MNTPGQSSPNAAGKLPRSRRRRGWRWTLWMLAGILASAGLGRVLLPSFIQKYVNQTLDRSPLYMGRIGEVQIHLWRGAYTIDDIRLSKTTGNVPVPLFSARRVAFALEWKALLHRKVVGRVLMEEPELNFVAAPSEGEMQTGAGGPWLEMIQELFPFTINSARVENGSVHFRTYQKQKPVDVYLSHLEASVENLRNTTDDTAALAATVSATALAMDQAKLEFRMTLDPFSYRPTFHMAGRLLGLDVTKLNDLAMAYGNFDFKGGWFDMIVEADSQEGQLNGYVKPLFRNLRVLKIAEDLKEDTALQFFWRSLMGAVTTVFKNRSRNQFGTLIPFSSDASGTPSTDILATVGNVLRNAFIRAYLPRLEDSTPAGESIHFDPPRFDESLSASDAL